MAFSSLAVPVVTSLLGTGGIASFVFSRRLQKAQSESIIVEASGKFVKDVSEQMERMDKRMHELEATEEACQQKLKVLQRQVFELQMSKWHPPQ